MRRQRLFWQIYPMTLAATVLALAVITVYALSSFDSFFQEQTLEELEEIAGFAGQAVAAQPSAADRRTIDALCKEAGARSDKRITVVLPSGTVSGDSEEDPAAMENHGDRAEIREALAGGVGVATRLSQTLHRKMMYVALPVKKDGRVIAVVRSSMPIRTLTDLLHALDARIMMEAAAVAVIAGLLLLLLSRRLVRPLEEIRRGAEHFRAGDLSWRVRVQGPAEVQALAETMNEMAAGLSARIERLKQLEGIRREFVANVSHELKTPVTSIRGFAETLRDGSVDNPKLAKQHLEIVAAQAARLSSIIEDLLQLSRIEQEEEADRPLVKSPASVRKLIDAAIDLHRHAAEEQRISLDVACPDDLGAVVNAPLLEQAIANLVDNAIKYGGGGKPVRIAALADEDAIRISVTDEGPGIPEEHRSRIFERFYRVDKGRSRRQGGTGLGLAIVKHICAAHGGSVAVASEEGRGSTFTITLPREPSA